MRIVAFPLYVLTLGLLSFIVNGLLLMLVAWISGLLGFGLVVESFWWGVLGAFVLGIFSWLFGLLVRPLNNSSSLGRAGRSPRYVAAVSRPVRHATRSARRARCPRSRPAARGTSTSRGSGESSTRPAVSR